MGRPRGDLPSFVETFARRNAFAAGDEPAVHPVAQRLDQMGVMRMAKGEDWMPFTARQTIGLHDAGFVWHARFRGPMGLPVEVIDAFMGGAGHLEARLLGSLPLMRRRGGGTDVAEAQRALAELPWAPLAILANPHLEWRQSGEDAAEVTLHTRSGPTTVRLLFAGGEVVRAEAAARMREPGRWLPWRGDYGPYERIGDVRLPSRAVVSWWEDGGWRPCWRGEIVSSAYLPRGEVPMPVRLVGDRAPAPDAAAAMQVV